MSDISNRLVLSGKITSLPRLSHEMFNEKIYYARLSVPRLSGSEDDLHLTIPGTLLSAIPALNIGDTLHCECTLRSYNITDEAGQRHLLLTAFVDHFLPTVETPDVNQLTLTGVICKPPMYRKTPFGREITDMMVCVDRAHGKRDYIPCIAWGSNARYASRLKPGSKVALTGRLQSRQYDKLLPDGTMETRMTLEVSINRLTFVPTQPSTEATNPSTCQPVPAIPVVIQNGGIMHA